MPSLELARSVALIVVDVQVGTTSNPTAHPVATVIHQVTRLIDVFRAADLPVVLANVTGTPAGQTAYGAGERSYPPEWSALLPDLKSQPGDLLVSRRTWSAFAGTALDEELRARSINQVVVVGLATSFGVESTARDPGRRVAP